MDELQARSCSGPVDLRPIEKSVLNWQQTKLTIGFDITS